MKESISTTSAPGAVGPYSQGVKSGGLLFLSGQIALDPATGALVQGGVAEQTARACENVLALLRSQGLAAENVVKTTIFVTSMDDFATVNTVYAGYFPAPSPARSCVEVSRLPLGALVEIEAVAAL